MVATAKRIESEEKEKSPSETVHVLAEMVYLDDGYSELSVEKLARLFCKQPQLQQYLLRQAAKDALTYVQRAARSKISGGSPRVYSKEMQESVQIALGKYMSWPMMNGKMLADADRDEVQADAASYQANAEGNLRNARFLTFVANGLKEGQTVSDVFTEAKLAKLMAKARGE